MLALVALVLSLVLGFVLIGCCRACWSSWAGIGRPPRPHRPWLTSAIARWRRRCAGELARLAGRCSARRCCWSRAAGARLALPAGIGRVQYAAGRLGAPARADRARAGRQRHRPAGDRARRLERVQALRTPLDAALDVDIHFREFPRKAIPRVRIAERYVALLEFVVDRGYERIVIVAHSQGSVITAELLRYLQQRAKLFDDDRAPATIAWSSSANGWSTRRGSTCSRWAARCGSSTPRASRACTAGCSTARRCERAAAAGAGPASLVQPVGRGRLRRTLVVVGRPADRPVIAVGRRCRLRRPAADRPRMARPVRGEMAHTHYFELDQADVRAALGYLIVTAP